jgi:hypothetical protein
MQGYGPTAAAGQAVQGKPETVAHDAIAMPPATIFKSGANVDGGESRLAAGENQPNLKFEREDWSLFRTIEGLQQKAGVSKDKLSRLVLKELADNGLDTGARVSVDELPVGGYFVEDDGPGLDGEPKDIARLFSIRRPMVSSKLLRLPQRGALGNGLRVVAGAVLASEGSLTVITLNRRVVLRPERDGTTTVVGVEAVTFPVGTRIEIGFGPALPCDKYTLNWARMACHMARTGSTYLGKSSPLWFDVPAFHELLDASGDLPVCELIARLDGGGNAAEIAARAGLSRATCQNLDRKKVAKLLAVAQEFTGPVDPKQLGSLGPGIFPTFAYAVVYGNADLNTVEIPFVIESWVRATKNEAAKTWLRVCVNRTPVTGDIRAARDNRDIDFYGCGLRHNIAGAAKDTQFDIWLNITVPYMPITSDGKAPDLLPFLDAIKTAVGKAVRKASPAPPAPDDTALLPKRGKGRQSPEAEARYRQGVDKFCALIRQIKSTLDFAVGSRGWCYILEPHGLLKGDFKSAETLITDCRKSGDLPLDICAEDASRSTIGVEQIDSDDVPEKVESLIDDLLNHAHERYLPISIWDDLDVYVEVATEKLDLRNLFEPVCREFHVPITNFKGWSDLNARAKMMRHFKMHEAASRRCVLLLCGDHDPGGLHITDMMRKNMEDLSEADGVGWSPDNLVIIRFGLNADFIDENDLTWIDNLETSSGKRLDDPNHPDHDKEYVQDYITEFGVRKCEANALVVKPEVGRQLCRDAILEHIPADSLERYERKLDRLREQLRRSLRKRVS